MKITARVTYAISAVFELATHPPQQRVQAREIAARQQIPLRFLQQILTQLKKADLVKSVHGPAGGYALEKSADEITLKDVMAAVEGEVLFFDPGLSSNTSITKVWMEIEEYFQEKLESISIQDLIRRKIQEDEVIVYHI
jgi:Rrf2 family protein